MDAYLAAPAVAPHGIIVARRAAEILGLSRQRGHATTMAFGIILGGAPRQRLNLPKFAVTSRRYHGGIATTFLLRIQGHSVVLKSIPAFYPSRVTTRAPDVKCLVVSAKRRQ